LSQLWLGGQISNRHYHTRKGLPDAIDLMLTSVEAGLSLDAAMLRVAEFHRGPFQVELERALQDMTLGMSRRDALEGICERLDVPEVVTFIQTVNHAEITGAPIGQVLRVQAEQIRVKRRQAAEAQANRAPLLMIFPLVFFIFPSIFVVLLAPAIMTMIDILTNNEVLGG
jgi:tight adherence protein C